METTSKLALEEPVDELDPRNFSSAEIASFHADDAQAGRSIAKILCTLFFYTAAVMSYIVWWTFRTVNG